MQILRALLPVAHLPQTPGFARTGAAPIPVCLRAEFLPSPVHRIQIQTRFS